MESVRAFLRFETVCTPGADLNVSPSKRDTFLAAKRHLTDTYSDFLNSSEVSVTDVSTYSMLIEWTGTDSKLQPLLLYGHYDVVPVGSDSIASWTHEPFAGGIHDGCALEQQCGHCYVAK